MAYRRSLSTRATLIARLNSPSISYIPYDHDRTLSQQKINNFIQPSFFGSCFNDSYGSGGLFPSKRISQFVLAPSAGSAYCRYMSSTVGEGSENIESISDVAEVLKDTTIDAVANQAPALNEVAVAVADSFLPVSALQHFIDIVPNFTGWWASIAVTALLVRSAALPLLVIQHKENSKLGLVSPLVMKIKQQMQEKGMDLESVAEGQKQMAIRFGVTPFTPLKWLFINGPIFMGSLFVISSMAEKVSSFKNGGAFWLTDLSSPDSFYIFPILIFPILYGFQHINKGIKEIMADYVHQEMTRTWILVCLRLFLLIVIKDVFLFYG